MKDFEIRSSAFKPNEIVPKPYTCDGLNISPPLTWSGVPAGTESFALIVDDPDAPMRVWDHWVLYNIPANVTAIDEGGANVAQVGQGLNSSNKTGYYGLCPPDKEHRYFFKLYALDAMFKHLNNPTKQELLEAMHGHVLGEAVLMGRYDRPRRK
jgi:Raf kinase inhibitor-like YbhB/YbcL family protein